MGMILVTASVAVFVWAVVGLIRPTWARLPSRAASVGVWFLSVVLFIIGGALMPDSTPEQTEQSAALGSQSEIRTFQCVAPHRCARRHGTHSNARAHRSLGARRRLLVSRHNVWR